MSIDRNNAFVKSRLRNDFESLELPLAEFNHRAHVRLAWTYLTEYPLPEALIRFRDGLKKFAGHHGKSTLYHETITFMMMMLIHERMHSDLSNLPHASWERFESSNPDLINRAKEVLLELYTSETLFSEEAKARFRMPDFKPRGTQ